MNEHSDFWYRYIHGDKETFHFAWRKLGMEYAMPARPIEPMEGVMCPHDVDGSRVFQHRNLAKWTLDRPNRLIPGFLFEEQAIDFLQQLRAQWAGRPRLGYDQATASNAGQQIAQQLCCRRWTYRRVGHDERSISFALDGTVKEGAACREQLWRLNSGKGEVSQQSALEIIGDDAQITCRLKADRDHQWTGRWENYERMLIELVVRGAEYQASTPQSGRLVIIQ